MQERQWLIRNPVLMVVFAIVVPAQVWAFLEVGNSREALWFVLPVLLLVLLSFGFLHVRLDFGRLRLAYFPIWRRTVPMGDIVSAKAVPYRWLAFGGWGIRMNSKSVAYSVWSKQAIELDIKGAKHTLVFTTNDQAAWLEALGHAGVQLHADDESDL